MTKSKVAIAYAYDDDSGEMLFATVRPASVLQGEVASDGYELLPQDGELPEGT